MRRLSTGIDVYSPRVAGLIKQSHKELDRLRELSRKWGVKNVPDLYKYVQDDTDEWLKKSTGATVLPSDRSFGLVNKQAVEALLNDPKTGFLTATNKAIDSVQDGLDRIHKQAKLIKSHAHLVNKTLAHGIIEGKAVNVVRAELTKQLMSSKGVSNLGWVKDISQIPKNNLLREMADLPFVKIPTKTAKLGYRRLRLDRYAEMVVRTKTRQAVTTARRNKLAETGHVLVKVNNRKSTVGDACDLYINKAFALTAIAAKKYGVPAVRELPNGGVPFHPNCKHFEIPVTPSRISDKEWIELTTPPPRWALNQPFGVVNKIYQKKGFAEGKRSPTPRPGAEKIKLPDPEPPPPGEKAVPTKLPKKEKWLVDIQRKINSFGGKPREIQDVLDLGVTAKRYVHQKISQKEKSIKTQLLKLREKAAKVVKERVELNREIGKKRRESGVYGITKKDKERIRKNGDKMIKLKEKRSLLEAKRGTIRQDIVEKELSKFRELGGTPIKFAEGVHKEGAELIQNVSKMMPTDWIKKINEKGPLKVRVHKPGALGEGVAAQYKNSEHAIELTTLKEKGSALHELGHAAVFSDYNKFKFEKELIEKLKKGGAEILPLGAPYPSYVVGLDKGFKDRYSRRVYFKKKPGESFAMEMVGTEITSTGIESLWGLSRHDSIRDKNLMDFMFGSLFGL